MRSSAVMKMSQIDKQKGSNLMKENAVGDPILMTPHQLQAELMRCEYCEEAPCTAACPCDCSPFDFIMAARDLSPSDIKRSAAEIMSSNPLGGVCCRS